ncbi:unnamed protein product, partial [Ectocarpus sp. 8 AP-2014]
FYLQWIQDREVLGLEAGRRQLQAPRRPAERPSGFLHHGGQSTRASRAGCSPSHPLSRRPLFSGAFGREGVSAGPPGGGEPHRASARRERQRR